MSVFVYSKRTDGRGDKRHEQHQKQVVHRGLQTRDEVEQALGEREEVDQVVRIARPVGLVHAEDGQPEEAEATDAQQPVPGAEVDHLEVPLELGPLLVVLVADQRGARLRHVVDLHHDDQHHDQRHGGHENVGVVILRAFVFEVRFIGRFLRELCFDKIWFRVN